MTQNRKSASLLVKAASAVVEMLEERRLLSQTIFVSTTQMVFNAVQNSSASQIETETITNIGNAPLTLGIGSTTLANDPAWPTADSARFQLINGASVPPTLNPGQSFGLQLQYSATSVTTNSAYLDIASDDPINPSLQIQLRGIGTKGLGGSNQPSLATILRAYNIPTQVGEGPNDSNALADSVYPYPPDPSSQEVVVQRFVKSGSGPVTINALASFTASGTHPYVLGTYAPGNPNALSELFTTLSSEYQSTYIHPQGATTFDPGASPFGFYFVSNVQVKGRVGYSEDALNTWDSTTGRHFRFFPMENPDGSIQANTYIMTSTEWNAPIGYDFTNIVAIVHNIKPAPGAPTAPVLGLEDLNAVPGSSTMVFDRIQSPNTLIGDIVHDTGTLRVHDTGGSPLILNSYTLSSGYTLVSPPAFPVTIAAGGSLDLTIKFIQSSRPSVPYNETNGPLYASGGGVLKGSITFSTNDPNAPTATKALAGWWQFHSENENEPSLQTIVNLLHGWTTNINPKPIPVLTEAAASTTSMPPPTYYGEEVVSAYWQQVDASLGVKVRQLDSYHTEGNSVNFYWYPKGGGSNKIITTTGDTGQTLFPTLFNTSTPAAATFSTSSTFGFRVDNEYSDDAKNVASASSSNSGGGHHIRFYPVRDAAGKLVPNTYLLCLDYTNAPQNFDFQDNVYLISNIRPSTQTSAPPDLYATNANTGNLLQWSSVPDSGLQGYNVYRAAAATGTYTLLTPSPNGTIFFNDTSAPSTGTSYYKVTAVAGNGESIGATVSIVNTSNGSNNNSGGTSTPMASSESANTLAGSAVTINEFPHATDTGATLIASTVTISTQPSNGSASVNVSNGSITYTPNAGFTGTDIFAYTVSDTLGNTSPPAFITVNVSSVPIGNPIVANLSVSTPQNNAAVIDVVSSATDTGATIDPTTVTVVQAPGHGTTTVNASTGAITYTPAAGYAGSDSFQYTISDSLQTTSQPGTVTLSVVAGAPVAGNVTAPPIPSTGTNLINVVAAATDTSGTIDPTSVKITTAPANGIAVVNSATGAITYTPNSGFTGVDTLQYTLADTNHTVSAPAAVSFNVGLTINNTTARALTFYDAGGDRVRITLTGGAIGLIFFNGTGIAQTVPGPHGTCTITLAGPGLSISSMQITGSTIAAALTVTRTGLAAVALNNISVDGAISRIIAPTSVLTGTLSIAGAVNLLQLGSISGATITIGSAGASRAGLAISAGHVSNTSLTSGTRIRSLRAIEWTETGATDAINAPSITSLMITGAPGYAGNLGASITTTAGTPFSLQVARVAGQIAGDTWNIGGAASSIVAGSLASGWTGHFSGSIGSFNIRSGGFDGTLTAGAVNSVSVVGDDTGSITAASIRSVRIIGQLTDATISTTNGVTPHVYSLGRLSVTGAATNSEVLSAGNIGPITIAGLSGTSIDAGMAQGVLLPTTAADIVSAASIASVTVTGRGSTFSNSNIAAMTLGPLSLGEVITASSDTAFGVGAGAIKSMVLSLDTGGALLRLNGLLLLNGNSIDTFVAANHLVMNSFVIRPGL